MAFRKDEFISFIHLFIHLFISFNSFNSSIYAKEERRGERRGEERREERREERTVFWEGEGYLGVIKGIVLDMCVCVSMRERDE